MEVVAVVILGTEAGLEKIFILVALGFSCVSERVPVGRCPSQAEFGDCFVFKSPGVEIIESDSLSFCTSKLFLEKLAGIFRNQDKAFVPLSRCSVFSALGLFDNLSVVLLGQLPQGVGIGHVLMLHHESYCRTTFVTAETVVYPLGGNHMERRGFFIVERTASPPFGSTLAHGHEIRHHLFDLGGVEDLLYRFLRNHVS